MVPLQYYDYTKHSMLSDSFPLIYLLHICGCPCRKGNKKNVNVNDHKNLNLGEEAVWTFFKLRQFFQCIHNYL